MSFGKFFKDALLPVAVWACGVLLSCFVLTVAGAPVSIVVVRSACPLSLACSAL